MIKAILDDGLAPLAAGGLVIFVLVFVGVAAWVMSRSRQTVDTWASLPLADGLEPVQPRGGAIELPIVSPPADGSSRGARDHGESHEEAKHSCGECENCNC